MLTGCRWEYILMVEVWWSSFYGQVLLLCTKRVGKGGCGMFLIIPTPLSTQASVIVTAHSVLYRSFYTHYQYKSSLYTPSATVTCPSRVFFPDTPTQSQFQGPCLPSNFTHCFYYLPSLATPAEISQLHGVNPTDTHITDYERNAHLINTEPDLHRRHQSQDVTTPNHPMERRPHQDNDPLHLTHK